MSEVDLIADMMSLCLHPMSGNWQDYLSTPLDRWTTIKEAHAKLIKEWNERVPRS